ncbi:M1 family metallopeptidase [Spirillospora sp. NPDC047279]|uniref:M1 family metallopeptidase n=1 Tax=Spirillospora sp. NPDC047279 TaxID=3155478 RepID=UPI00340B316E
MNGPWGRMAAAATAAAVLVSMNGEAATATGSAPAPPECPPSSSPAPEAQATPPAESPAPSPSGTPAAPLLSGLTGDGEQQWPALPPEGTRPFRRMAVPPPEAAANPLPAPAPADPAAQTPPGASTALEGCEPAASPPPSPPVTVVQPPAGRPGAAGVGDPYFRAAGNGGYDAQNYDVALAYTPKGGKVDATVTVTARATQNLSRFNLDFRGPKILDITVNGGPAGFRRKGQELTVTPAATLTRGSRFTAVVRYSGRPGPIRNDALGTYGWVPSRDGAVVVAEPDGAPTWLPVNDHPRDKATFAFRVTVPDNLQVLANGVPGRTVRQGGRATYAWTETSPMAPYLAMVAIGRFQVRRGKAGRIPVITAVDPKFAKSAAAFHKNTIKVLAWESKVFGPYPFATAGGIVDDPRLDYALETQERPVYAGFVPDDDFIVHELAHQWFGNSVSLRSWPDIWLNEGFATYAEWLWRERGKKDSAKKIFKRYYRQPGGSPIFNPPPGRPGRGDLFSFSVYIRGAMCLQALRQKVGDKAFFKILKTWAKARHDSTAATPQFVAHAEKVSGKQLDRLFKVWLYTKGKPKKW